MEALHVDADTFMHRLPARLKIIALMLLSVALFATDRIWILSIALVCGAFLYLRTGMPVLVAMRRLRPVLLTIIFVAAFSLFFNPWSVAVVTVVRLSALTLFAAVVTATTDIAAFMDAISAAARPLERLGLARADDIGLAVALVIRFVPEIIGRQNAIREACQARGIPFRLWTGLVPLIILTLKDADNIAAAIDARGIRRH
jgi:biotin transport system permease protein